VICDAALVFGYAEERHQIDFRLLQEVLGELETTGILPAASGTQAPPALMPDATTHAVPVQAARARAAEPVAVTAAVQEQLVARAAEDEAVRSTLLDQRELALAQRERELAEQRQVLVEEYGLLRTQRAHAAPGSGSAGVRLNPQRESNAERFPSARHDGVRGWLHRVLSGASHRPAEGS
jgi:hypothetical protein